MTLNFQTPPAHVRALVACLLVILFVASAFWIG